MKIRLKNFKGIKAGPELTWDGLDQIEVDFTGKQGLLAFAGENGGGKSTLLENLHHYPQLVSRGGALWQHVMGREAEKEFISAFMGHEYRSVIKMDADQGKQEGYLWRDGVPMVNGKITAYKERVNEIFGQPFTYFRSQFCPQKSKNTQGMQIENMTAGVFRELLQQFLNLQRYAAWEDTAKTAGNILSGQIAGIEERIKGLEETAGQFGRVYDEKTKWDYEGDAKNTEKVAMIWKVEDLRTQVDTLKATIQANALALARRGDIQKQIDRLNGELATEKAAAESDISGHAAKYREIKTAISGGDAILQNREAIQQAADNVLSLTEKADALQINIEAESAHLPDHQKAVHALETQIAGIRQRVKDLEGDAQLREIEKKTGEAQAALGSIEKDLASLDNDSELSTLRADLAGIERAAKVGEGIKADCRELTCGAIAAVLEAKEKLPTASGAVEYREQQIAEKKAFMDNQRLDIVAAIDILKASYDYRHVAIISSAKSLNEQVRTVTHSLGNAQRAVLSTTEILTHHRQDLATKRAEIAKQKALADRLPGVRVAEQRKTDLEKQLAEVTKAGTDRKKAWEAKKAEMEAANEYNYGALAAYRIDNTADAALLAAQKEITEIETVKIPAVEKEIQAAREKIATLQAELTRIEAAEKELETAKAQRDTLSLKVSRWRYLQLGCGKTGLQNLRIDGAAPRIIYNANRLLSQAYGARYAVRLETQNEAGKEDLQIKIIMENGQEVYLDDISGGQRCWVVQSLWLAMSLLNQEKSGKQFTYFAADEADGALDPDNAEKFTALYRPFLNEAKLEQLLFISHKPECRAMADHILSFQHGENPKWG